MLARLQIREKLTLLVVVPLIAVALLLVPLLAGRLDVARSAGKAATSAELARSAGGVVEGIRRARLLSVGYLADAGSHGVGLSVALADVAAGREVLARDAEAAGNDELAEAAADPTAAGYGALLLSRSVTPEAAIDELSAQVKALIDGLRLNETGFAGTARSLGALDALLRSDEAASRGGARLLLAALSQGSLRSAQLEASGNDLAASMAYGEQFVRQVDADAAALYDESRYGASGHRLEIVRQSLVETGGVRRLEAEGVVGLYDAVVANGAARLLVETRVAQQVATSASSAARSAQLGGYVVGGVVGGLALLVVALVIVVGRSVSRPLRQLTGAAGRVADLAQEELLRVSDEDHETAGAVRLAAVDVAGGGEIGQLAEAFNRVQATAALLLERQVHSRRNVATMFAGVGRRTTNLVARQLALIDRLERSEDDPDVLAMLYRLDHVATRLRRNASSLVVLSGGTEGAPDGCPVALADALRAALGSVEEYQRVAIGRLPETFVAPGAAPDLMLLIAELMENAVLFSPPTSTIEVSADRLPGGACVVGIVDHGLGMSAERVAEENTRLRQRERLDIAPTEVLGLFVVGRIARRHGVKVLLEPTAGQGVTAVVTLPPSVLVEAPVPTPGRTTAAVPLPPGAAPGPPPAVPGRALEARGRVEFAAPSSEPTVRPELAGPQNDGPQNDGAQPPRPLLRRRPGQALAALEEAGWTAAGAVSANGRPRKTVGAPERPEQVRAWADDLESVIAEVDALLGIGREPVARAPDETRPRRLRAVAMEHAARRERAATRQPDDPTAGRQSGR